jgi:hypothetical protein
MTYQTQRPVKSWIHQPVAHDHGVTANQYLKMCKSIEKMNGEGRMQKYPATLLFNERKYVQLLKSHKLK